MNLFFAQIKDDGAGRLDARRRQGGPRTSSCSRSRWARTTSSSPTFTRKVFDIYRRVGGLRSGQRPRRLPQRSRRGAARASIYRGQEIFNNYEFAVSGVPGFNDVLAQETVMAPAAPATTRPTSAATP